MDACGLKLRWAQGKGLEVEAALVGWTSGFLPLPVPCGLPFVLSPSTHTSLLRTLCFCKALSPASGVGKQGLRRALGD